MSIIITRFMLRGWESDGRKEKRNRLCCRCLVRLVGRHCRRSVTDGRLSRYALYVCTTIITKRYVIIVVFLSCFFPFRRSHTCGCIIHTKFNIHSLCTRTHVRSSHLFRSLSHSLPLSFGAHTHLLWTFYPSVCEHMGACDAMRNKTINK